jgi:hypothetical protein
LARQIPATGESSARTTRHRLALPGLVAGKLTLADNGVYILE